MAILLPVIDQGAGTPGPPVQSSSQCQKGCEGGERRRLADIRATKVQGGGRTKTQGKRMPGVAKESLRASGPGAEEARVSGCSTELTQGCL